MINRFEIRKSPFSIRFNRRELYAYYDHYVMNFDISGIEHKQLEDCWVAERITEANIDYCENEAFSVNRMKRYMKEQPEYVDGFLFFNSKTEEPAGFVWVMYPGGNEFQYRIRRIDAFLFDVFVFPEYRGRNLCGQMFQYIFEILNIDEKKAVSLGVRTDNKSAIRAYKKAGGVVKSRKRYIQLCHRYNIPYYTV